MKVITKTIWILSLVSLFTDVASEMLYPVMPLFLKHIGYSVLFIGILEGIAEAVAGLSKGYFGRSSDLSGKRLPFVRLGYTLSAISKPMLAILTYPWWIFLSRTIDRLGKGIRMGARDAMLSQETTSSSKGKVFGFHRSFDTIGAVLGPSIALAYLYYYPDDFSTLFLIAFVPGILAVGGTFLIKEAKQIRKKSEIQYPRVFSFFQYWKSAPTSYRKLAGGLLIFTLVNSSDVFLLLKMKESGLSDTKIIGVYIFYNLVYALFAYPMGKLGDRIGLKKVLSVGLCLFVAVYAGFAISHNLFVFIFLFGVYGIYAAATEGISKAWISNIVDEKDTATAIGTYSGFQSICALISSSLAGLLWFNFGASFTFMVSAVVTLGVVFYFQFQASLKN